MERFLAYVSGYLDTIWSATNGEVFRYVSAWKQLVFSADGKRAYNPTDKDLWIGTMKGTVRIPSGGTSGL